ncbi:MAG: hypothetical protein U0939_22390 [Pirellulales bacterium]
MLKNCFLAAALLPAVMGGFGLAQSASLGSIAKSEKWRGTATATCKCADNKCKVITCEVKGAASYEDAKRRLKAELEAKARTENGRIVGEASFSITKEL